MYIYSGSGHNMNITIVTTTMIMTYIYSCSGHNMNITIVTTSMIMKCRYIFMFWS